jgi:hypothetical protein
MHIGLHNIDEQCGQRVAGRGQRLALSSTGSGSTKAMWHCRHQHRSVGMTLQAPLRSKPTKNLKRHGVKLLWNLLYTELWQSYAVLSYLP